MNIVGVNIRHRREELGWSQTDLAHKMGYKTKVSISNVENGHMNLSTESVVKFANALMCTPAELMGWHVETNDNSESRLSAYAKLIEAYENAPSNIQQSVCLSLGVPYVRKKDSSEMA